MAFACDVITISQRVTHYCVVEDLNCYIHLYAYSTEGTFLQYCLVILKRMLQNYLEEMFLRLITAVNGSPAHDSTEDVTISRQTHSLYNNITDETNRHDDVIVNFGEPLLL